MEIKEVILKSEKERVIEFLSSFGLSYRADTEYTVYIEENDEIVGTVSYTGNIIMELAVSRKMQGENLAAVLVSHITAKLRESGIYGYKVFTKPEYASIFENMGFRPLVKDVEFAAFEGGESDIASALSALKRKAVMEIGELDGDTAAIVINGNPFTEGHLALCEHALSRHKRLLLFVLEEDSSEFSFKERFSLAFLATRPYSDRVSVLPSTEYIVSRATFPDYFLHGADETTRAYAKYDAMIFEKYFMPALSISKRYFGSEVTDYMQIYNDTMRSVLADKAEFVERFEKDGKTVSAKSVRALIKSGKYDEALSLVPVACRAVMSLIINGKYGNR
jgi:[citrate (pro-3S)-lyase] ligase